MITPEPAVGQVYTIRTFRVTREGILTGLHLDGSLWSDGENIATCGRSQRAVDRFGAHQAPDPQCRCGFYGYTTASPDAPANHVQAVISCTGPMVSGDLGLRAQKARIVALYFGELVPWTVKDRVLENYPLASGPENEGVFADRKAMLAKYDIPVDAVENPGTFHGFEKSKGTQSRFRSWVSRTVSTTPKSPRANSPLQNIGYGLNWIKGCCVGLLAIWLLFTSMPSMVWFASALDPSLLGWFHDMPAIGQGRAWWESFSASHTWMPWFFTFGYLVLMNCRLKSFAVSLGVCLAGPAVAAAPWALSVAPQGSWSSWVTSPGLMTTVALAWMSLVAVAVTLLIRVSITRADADQRRIGQDALSGFKRGLAEDLGAFVFAPSPATTTPADKK